MSTVQLLTPTASGAIATLRLVGQESWLIIRQLAQPLNGRQLPEQPSLFQTHLVRLGGDEVVLAVRELAPVPVIELHCHGGLRIIQAITEKLVQLGVQSLAPTEPQVQHPSLDLRAEVPLSQARTLRAASILLDQYHGAFKKALLAEEYERLVRWSGLGARLVSGWKLVIAGAPNTGKSSLLNRLAGYDRAIVSPVAGTTRDVVSTTIALEGWPVEIFDTAGVRFSVHELESEGIRRTRAKLREADLVLWLLDATSAEPSWPTELERASTEQTWVYVWNKIDEAPDLPYRQPDDLSLSAKTGDGVALLVGRILRHWVPTLPEPGQGLPFTPELAAQLLELERLRQAGNLAAAGLLRQALLSG
jgi:tRNA modification GTPase